MTTVAFKTTSMVTKKMQLCIIPLHNLLADHLPAGFLEHIQNQKNYSQTKLSENMNLRYMSNNPAEAR